MDKYAPMTSWTKKDNGPPWLDAEYKKNRALRRKFERTWRKDRTNENMLKYAQQKKLCAWNWL